MAANEANCRKRSPSSSQRYSVTKRNLSGSRRLERQLPKRSLLEQGIVKGMNFLRTLTLALPQVYTKFAVPTLRKIIRSLLMNLTHEKRK